jgi:hypothetical protein
MFRCAQDLRNRPALDNAAGIHDRDRIGDFGSNPEIMGDKDHTHAQLALEPAEQDQDLNLHCRVERGGRLVRQQQARIARQRHRDHRPLAQAARQFVRIGVEPPLGGWPEPEVENRECHLARQTACLLQQRLGLVRIVFVEEWLPVIGRRRRKVE